MTEENDSPYFLDTIEKLQQHIKQNPDGGIAKMVGGITDQLKQDIENEILKQVKENDE